MDPVVLFIIVFVLAPIIERILKGRQQQQPPPPQQRPRPQRPLPRPRPEETRTPAPRSEQERDEAAAADMLPDDLWEILTGQRREQPPFEPREEMPAPVESRTEQPLPLPKPQRPRPVRERKRPHVPEPERTGRMQSAPDRRPVLRGEAADDEESRIPQEATREQYPVEGYRREIPRHAAPEIVSLEELVIDDEKRHTRFHERIAASQTVKPKKVQPNKLAKLLQQPDQVRQAIVLSEVLGKPKGLH